jgi:hypothetical protein
MHPGSRKSSTVRLVLMGAAVGGSGLLAGCGTDVQRNRYNSREDCVADYSQAQCGPDFPVGAAAAIGAATYYYGPWYRSDAAARLRDPNDPGAGSYFRGGGAASSGTRAPTGVEAGTRGGFGSTGRVSARGS